MKLTVLGSGTSVPQAGRRPPAFLVSHKEAGQRPTHLLVDCGAGCATSLAAHGITLDLLHGIALTHLHLDHTLELAGMLFALHNPMGPDRAGDLCLWGPRGTDARLSGLRQLYGSWIDPRQAAITTTELDDSDCITAGPLAVHAFAVEHGGAAALSYRIEDGRRAVCLSGDSGYCDGLIEAARGVDLFVCECAALEDEGATGHLSAEQVGGIAAAAGCGRVLLTHLYEHIVASDPVSRVERAYDGPIALACDGLVVDL